MEDKPSLHPSDKPQKEHVDSEITHALPSKEPSIQDSTAEGNWSRRTLTKIDLRVLPTIFVIHVMAILDKANLGNALIFNLEEDLGLHGLDVSVALCVYLVAYGFFDIPMTILMKKATPHVFLSICMFSFGLLVIIEGLVQNYSGLLAVRFLIGVAEAGTYPGGYYLISMWYKRCEAQRRFTFFYVATTVAGAIGGLLVAGIGTSDGFRGWHAWRWIFIWEGTITCVLAFIAFFVISDFPEEAKWLTREERLQVIKRLAEEQGSAGIDTGVTLKDVLKVLGDWTLTLGSLIYLSSLVPMSGLVYFLPSIIDTYGGSRVHTQLYVAGPWVAAFFCSMFIAYASDKLRRRYHFIIGCQLVSIVGLVVLLAVHDNDKVQYAGVFLLVIGVSSGVPLVVCWYAMNLRGHQERAVGIPWLVTFGCGAGIISVFAFPEKDAPRYMFGYSLCLGFACLALVLSTVYYVRCLHLNRRFGSTFYIL